MSEWRHWFYCSPHNKGCVGATRGFRRTDEGNDAKIFHSVFEVVEFTQAQKLKHQHFSRYAAVLCGLQTLVYRSERTLKR